METSRKTRESLHVLVDKMRHLKISTSTSSPQEKRDVKSLVAGCTSAELQATEDVVTEFLTSVPDDVIPNVTGAEPNVEDMMDRNLFEICRKDDEYRESQREASVAPIASSSGGSRSSPTSRTRKSKAPAPRGNPSWPERHWQILMTGNRQTRRVDKIRHGIGRHEKRLPFDVRWIDHEFDRLGSPKRIVIHKKSDTQVIPAPILMDLETDQVLAPATSTVPVRNPPVAIAPIGNPPVASSPVCNPPVVEIPKEKRPVTTTLKSPQDSKSTRSVEIGRRPRKVSDYRKFNRDGFTDS